MLPDFFHKYLLSKEFGLLKKSYCIQIKVQYFYAWEIYHEIAFS